MKYTYYHRLKQYKQAHYGQDPPSEQDDWFLKNYDGFGNIGEYRTHSFDTRCFEVFVDGRPMHKLKKERNIEFKLHVRLLPLRAPFWEVCDCYNQALCDLGSSLFTDKGRPKIDSLKDAIACSADPCAEHQMLYSDDFYVPFEYRMTASTVGPLIIKKMLQLFEDFFSIAMYIPYRLTQFT